MLSIPRTLLGGIAVGAAVGLVVAVVLLVTGEDDVGPAVVPVLVLLGALWALPAAAAALAVGRLWSRPRPDPRTAAALAAALAAAFLPLLLGYYPHDAGVARLLLLTALPAALAAAAVWLGWSRLQEPSDGGVA